MTSNKTRGREFERIIARPGAPTNASQRIPAVLYDRYVHGESVAELAHDYGLPIEQVEWGIRIGYLLLDVQK